MLKKALACASLAVAAAGVVAPAAMASDTSGGHDSQNVNLVPHPCVDAKNILNGIGAVGAQVPVLNGFEGQECAEKSKVTDLHKEPLSDLIDAGAYQN